MSTPYHSREALGMRRRKSAPSKINSQGQTAHYGGPTPWKGADISSPAAFRDSTDHNRCASIWRAWQNYHMDAKGWTDIAYNSGVCPHGHRFEGRGPGARSGANGTNDGNARSTATCYIGGDNDPITDEAKMAYLDECARMGSAAKWQHGDWKPTACAGPSIRAWKADGWCAPNSVPTPTPEPAPQPQPQPSPPPANDQEYNMDFLDFRGGTVRGKHVDNLQGLLLATAGVLPGVRAHVKSLVNSQGFPDGIGGSGTKEALKAFQEFAFGKADLMVGKDTWRRLIEF